MPDRTIAGAMSGTSADGVDVAIVRVSGRGMEMHARLIRHHHSAYDANLRRRVFAVREAGAVALADLAGLARDISISYAEAVSQAAEGLGPLDAIAAHGQTLFHAPPLTIQWLDPSLLAARTGTLVVSDFRRADCAAGGQGAPLVPLADYLLFRHPTRTRALLNIGGIANLTYLPAGGGLDELIAFDTGPGNCISDMLMRPEADFDEGGKGAAGGKVIQGVLDQALANAWFAQRPPKSTDGPAMIGVFREAMGVDGGYARNDLLRTACELSARTIANAIRQMGLAAPEELIASGGGVHNAVLMKALHEELQGIRISITDDLGVPSAAKEAIAFALLGAATLNGEAGNVPSCTGAKAAVLLGSITPRPMQ